MPKDSGGLIMQPLDPKVYEALLEVYEEQRLQFNHRLQKLHINIRS